MFTSTSEVCSWLALFLPLDFVVAGAPPSMLEERSFRVEDLLNRVSIPDSRIPYSPEPILGDDTKIGRETM